MRIPAKQLSAILLALLVALGGAATAVQAHSAAAPVTITVAYAKYQSSRPRIGTTSSGRTCRASSPPRTPISR